MVVSNRYHGTLCLMLAILLNSYTVSTSAWIPFGTLSSVPSPTHPQTCRWANAKKQREDAVLDESGDTQRIKRKIRLNSGREATVISRTVPISNNWNITVWEWEKPAAIIESYWDAHGRMLGSLGSGTSINPTNSGGGDGNRLLDPFGLVTWPGAIVAAQELLRIQEQQQQQSTMFENQTVLVLGAGVGVEAQAAALLGAKRVIATDIHPTTLKLLDYGVQQEAAITNKNAIEARILDLFSMQDHPLPHCDVLLCADILYNDQLASQVTRRCAEGLTKNPRLKILITDSQRFVDHFATELNERLLPILVQQQKSHPDADDDGDVPPPLLAWEGRKLDKFRGSGVAIDEDQTYDVDARVIRIGF